VALRDAVGVRNSDEKVRSTGPTQGGFGLA
jgi:hypothetical protein